MEGKKPAVPERTPEPRTPESEKERPTDATTTADAVAEFDAARTKVLAQERERLAGEYTVLRGALMELRGKGGAEPAAKAEYERVRREYLREVTEHHVRGDVRLSKAVNDAGLERYMKGGMKGREGGTVTVFELGVDEIVDRVADLAALNQRFDMLIEHRPEGDEALVFIEKLLPESIATVEKSQLQKKTQLSREANMPKKDSEAARVKEDSRAQIREALDDVAHMVRVEREREKRRPPRERPHGIRKPGLIGRSVDKLKGLFGKNKSS